MSYWRNEELESVKQTQRAITSRNGLSYSGGQRVELVVPSNIKLFDGRKSYLNFASIQMVLLVVVALSLKRSLITTVKLLFNMTMILMRVRVRCAL